MIRNYLLTAIRNIRKQPGHFFINVLGLSLGMAVFIFIFQFVGFETSYDNFHTAKPIYRVATVRYAHNELVSENAAAMPPLAPLLVDNFQEVTAATRIYNDGNCIVTAEVGTEARTFDESKAFYADDNLFEIFNFNLIEGTKQSALNGTRKLALSESSAIRYFGSAREAMGKSLRVTGQTVVEYEVSGVYEDAPANSHFKPDMVFSFITYLDVVHPDWGVRTNWIWNDFYTYIIATGDQSELQAKINALAQTTWGEQYKSRDVNFEFELQPIQDIHTHSNYVHELEQNTSMTALNILVWISLITLVVAWINYINLTTARSLERAQEVGVRKAIGASRSHLMKQFFTEAVLINVVSVAFSVIFLWGIKDTLQQWIGVSFPFAIDRILIVAFCILAFGGLLSSIYPAWIMAGFSITAVLKSKYDVKRGSFPLRKALVLVQFMVSPLLLAGTYLIYDQTDYLLSRDIGITNDQILVMKSPRVQVGNMDAKFDLLKNQAEESSQIEAMSLISMLPGSPVDWYSSFRLYGDSTVDQYMDVNLVEYDFEKVLDLEVLAGRTFDRGFADSTSLVINEAAAKLWGYEPEEIIGRTFWWRYSPTIHHFDKTVIGVVNTYKQHAFTNEDEPIIYTMSRYTPAPFAGKSITVRLKTEEGIGVLNDEVERMAGLWQSTFPDDPFTYWFLDDAFEQNFKAETQLLKVIKLFSLIAVLIAGLGLFALTSFSVLQRTKEVGIRKALGATVPGIVRLLSGEYFILIMIAYLLSLPLMWYGAQYWLQSYELKVSPGVSFFLLPLIGSIVVGALSVMYKSITAARANPVDSLRSD